MTSTDASKPRLFALNYFDAGSRESLNIQIIKIKRRLMLNYYIFMTTIN